MLWSRVFRRRCTGVGLVACGVSVGLVATASASGVVALWWSVGGLVLTIVGSVTVVSQQGIGRSVGKMQCSIWWLLYIGVSFGFTSLAWSKAQLGTARIIRQSSVPLAVFAVTAFVAAFLIGFRVRVGVIGKPIRWLRGLALGGRSDEFRNPAVPIVVYAIGVVARLARIGMGRYGYVGNARRALADPSSLNQVLGDLEMLTRFGIVLLVVDAMAVSRSRRSRLLVFVGILSELAFAIVSGVKTDFVTLVFAIGLGVVASGGRLKLKWLGVGVLAFFVLVPVNLLYRERIIYVSDAGGSPLSVVGRLPGIATMAVKREGILGIMVGSVPYLADRLREIDNVALIMQRSPSEIPYRPATALIVGPVVGLIPRAVWRNKPIVSTGYAFSQQYYELPAGLFSASAVTIPGDLYRHGGWGTLLGGAAVLGIGFRALEDSFDMAEDKRLCLLFAGFFLVFMNLESDVVSLAITIVEVSLLAALVTRACYRPRGWTQVGSVARVGCGVRR